jgi:hypothetical protein
MRRTVISSVAAIVLFASGCSSALSPGATVAQAPAATKGARSARVAYSAIFDIAAAPGPGPISMSGEGLFDYAQKRGRMVFDMSEVLQPGGSPPEGSGEVEMIFAGPILYMKMPFLTGLLSEPKPWIKVDLEAARRGGANLSQLAQLGQRDPTQILELLRGATRSVDEVGSEDLRGTQTTHYSMVLDLVRAAEKASEEARLSVQDLIVRTGARTMPAEIWIDDDGRMRKMTYEVDLASAGADSLPAEPDSMRVAMELYEFGIEVVVEPPPEDQVVDLLKLIEAQQEDS